MLIEVCWFCLTELIMIYLIFNFQYFNWGEWVRVKGMSDKPKFTVRRCLLQSFSSINYWQSPCRGFFWKQAHDGWKCLLVLAWASNCLWKSPYSASESLLQWLKLFHKWYCYMLFCPCLSGFHWSSLLLCNYPSPTFPYSPQTFFWIPEHYLSWRHCVLWLG